MPNYILENESFKATIASSGAELVSMVRKADDKEYIWDAKPEVWKRHAPVLFPLVGKYKNNTCVYEGKEYYMSQHGFARDMEFETIYSDADSVVMVLTQNEASKEKYPFDFKLTISYKLEENKLTVGWEVENTNDKEMYFSIGAHPAFVGKGDCMTGTKLVFETQQDELEYEILNSDGVLGTETDILKLTDKKAVITADFFDRDALIFEHTDIKKVSLEEDGERIVSVSFDAPLFGIWCSAKKNNPFVCIEPWYGRADRADFCGELKDREYGNTLGAGEVFKAEYTMAFGE